MVTWADGREARCVEITPREVIAATEGGLWRWDRFTLTPLEPWVSGVGRERAVSLWGARVVLWHPESWTLWVATSSQLLIFRTDIERWEVVLSGGEPITSLGDGGREVWMERGRRLEVIDGFTLSRREASGEDAGVRWQGRKGWKPHPYPPYREENPLFRFIPADGSIEDWDWSTFRPTYDLYDSDYQRRYICYPKLGMGIADEKRMRIEVLQLGPAGGDVKALALDTDGTVWVGGINTGLRDGISRWDRRSGRWRRYGVRLTPGLRDQSVSDIAIKGNWVYFATRGGLVGYDKSSDLFRSWDRFAGLPSEFLWGVTLFADWVVVATDQGVSRFYQPLGLVVGSGDKVVEGMKAVRAISDGDTLWVAGLEGVFKGDRNFHWESVGGEKVIGDEPTRAIWVTPRTLYLGGRGGVRMLDRQSGRWSSIPARPYLDGSVVISLAADEEDSLLWIGTERGLFRYSRRFGYWRSYGQEVGLPHPRIQTLFLEADTLWIGTPKGLTRFLWNRPQRDF